MKATAQIFLSYVQEDEEKVEKLYQKLSDEGFKPWMAKKDILPGEQWESRIPQAIRRSDFFLVCLSVKSIDERGWIQREIKQALDIWQEMLYSDIYLIPVRLEKCEMPESLRKFQWVNLFEEDDWTRLVEAIQVGMERRAKVIKPTVQESIPSEPYPAYHQKMLELYETGSEYYKSGRWRKAVDYLEEASAIEPTYADLLTKLGEARKKLRRQRVIRIALGILNIVVFTIVFAIFQNQIAKIGDNIEKWWREIRATPTPTVAIPGIDRIEVYMNGGQLNLDQLPSLTSGQAVELEVIVFDTDGKRYAGDDLVCRWSVAPLGDEDKGISTDLCKTLYIPPQKYSSQTVVFEVEGLEQQFESSDPISMKFDIAK